MLKLFQNIFNYISDSKKYSAANIIMIGVTNLVFLSGYTISKSSLDYSIIIFYGFVAFFSCIIPKFINDVDQTKFRWFYSGVILSFFVLWTWISSLKTYINIENKNQEDITLIKLTKDKIKFNDSVYSEYKKTKQFADSIQLFSTLDTFLNNHEILVVQTNIEKKTIQLFKKSFLIDIPTQSTITCEQNLNCDSIVRKVCENISTPYISDQLGISYGFNFDKYNKCIESANYTEKYNQYDTTVFDTTYSEDWLSLNQIKNVIRNYDDSTISFKPSSNIWFKNYENGLTLKYKNNTWKDNRKE